MAPGIKFTPEGEPVMFMCANKSIAIQTKPDPTCPHLKAWFKGFLFKSKAHHGNLIGWAAAAFVRPFLQEFPILLIDAKLKSTGKTQLMSSLHYLLTGENCQPMIHTGSEEDMERRLSHRGGMKPGPIMLCLDNIRPKQNARRTIRSQFLCACSTTFVIQGRKLHGIVPVGPVLIMATMNGGQVEPDLSDRTWKISLTRPRTQSHRKLIPHPVEYVKQYRSELVSEIIYLLTNKPFAPPATFSTRFYNAEHIVQHVTDQLGLEWGLDHSVESADASVKQLYHLINDLGGEPKLTEILHRVDIERKRLPDLAEVCEGLERVAHGREQELRAVLIDNYLGQKFRVDDAVFSFKIVGDTLITEDAT
jgi:hypothetical protein